VEPPNSRTEPVEAVEKVKKEACDERGRGGRDGEGGRERKGGGRV